jgi:hypothetical protein
MPGEACDLTVAGESVLVECEPTDELGEATTPGDWSTKDPGLPLLDRGLLRAEPTATAPCDVRSSPYAAARHRFNAPHSVRVSPLFVYLLRMSPM